MTEETVRRTESKVPSISSAFHKLQKASLYAKSEH